MPVADHVDAVGVAAVDHPAHNPGRQHLAGRDQRFDLGQLSLLFLAAPPRLGCRSDRDHETRTPLQPYQPARGIEFRSQRTMAVLGRQRMQPPPRRLEPRLAFPAKVPLFDRVERPRTHILGLLSR